jgi:DNA-binding transcriptional regulator WhiA
MAFDEEAYKKLKLDWDDKSELLTQASNEKTRAKHLLDCAKTLNQKFKYEESQKMFLVAQKHYKIITKLHKFAYNECVIARRLVAESYALKEKEIWEKVRRKHKLDPDLENRIISAASELFETLNDILNNINYEGQSEELHEFADRAEIIIDKVLGEST